MPGTIDLPNDSSRRAFLGSGAALLLAGCTAGTGLQSRSESSRSPLTACYDPTNPCLHSPPPTNYANAVLLSSSAGFNDTSQWNNQSYIAHKVLNGGSTVATSNHTFVDNADGTSSYSGLVTANGSSNNAFSYNIPLASCGPGTSYAMAPGWTISTDVNGIATAQGTGSDGTAWRLTVQWLPTTHAFNASYSNSAGQSGSFTVTVPSSNAVYLSRGRRPLQVR